MIYSLLQNSVSFAEAMQFLALRAAKHAIFSGNSCKTEVLQEPHSQIIVEETKAFKKACFKKACFKKACFKKAQKMQDLWAIGLPNRSILICSQ